MGKFIVDEEMALKNAFKEAREKGKLFNVNTWKRKREVERMKIKKPLRKLNKLVR